jgi:hypothetical protein
LTSRIRLFYGNQEGTLNPCKHGVCVKSYETKMTFVGKYPTSVLAHLGGVALLMKKNELANPIKISLFGAVAVMTQSDQVPDLIEQFGHAQPS